MKTQKCTTGKILERTSLFILAITLSAGLFAQKSLDSFELKQYAPDFHAGNDEIIAALKSVKDDRGIYYEEELTLEEWISCLEQWAEKMNSLLDDGAEGIEEENLKLESWMIDLKEWKCPAIEEITEEEMQLEPWMYDMNCFMEKNLSKAKKDK